MTSRLSPKLHDVMLIAESATLTATLCYFGWQKRREMLKI
jgi:hypothetical protein